MTGRARQGATIRDVAARAGVSVATVSRTFAYPGRVRSETAERVRQAAAELDYRPRAAQRLAPHEPARVLLMVVAELFDSYFTSLSRGAQEVALARDYTLHLISTEGSDQHERTALARLEGADGLLLAGPIIKNDTIRMIARTRPVVVVNRLVAGVPGVLVDNVGGTRQAVDHLAGGGHRTLTYLCWEGETWVSGIRWRTILERATSLGMKARRLRVARNYPISEAAGRLLTRSETAVMAHNDALAADLIRGLREAGARVPDDICVLGFDDVLADRFDPALTSVAAPLRQLGMTAAGLLVDMIEGSASRPPAVTTLPSHLVVRESTRCEGQRQAEQSVHG